VVYGCAILLFYICFTCCTYSVVYMLDMIVAFIWCCVHMVLYAHCICGVVYIWCGVHVVHMALCTCGVVCMWCCVHVVLCTLLFFHDLGSRLES